VSSATSKGIEIRKRSSSPRVEATLAAPSTLGTEHHGRAMSTTTEPRSVNQSPVGQPIAIEVQETPASRADTAPQLTMRSAEEEAVNSAGCRSGYRAWHRTA